MPDGTYMLGSSPVEVRSGQTRSGSGEVIAGSTLTMDVALRNAVRFLTVPVAHASAMASQNPARVLGIERRKGAIAAGLDADLVVLDDSLHVCAAMVDGGWVSEAPV